MTSVIGSVGLGPRGGLRPAGAGAAHARGTVELLQELGDLFVCEGGQRVEDRTRARRGTAEDAIEHEGVKMNIGVQGRAERYTALLAVKRARSRSRWNVGKDRARKPNMKETGPRRPFTQYSDRRFTIGRSHPM